MYYKYFFENVCSQTSFYIFVNEIVCVDAKCTCLALSMLHMAVITKDIVNVFDSRSYSTGVSLTIVYTFGHFSYVFTGESVDCFTFTYTFL